MLGFTDNNRPHRMSPQEWEARGFVDAEKLEQKERSGV
jgi:hypothetical protein